MTNLWPRYFKFTIYVYLQIITATNLPLECVAIRFQKEKIGTCAFVLIFAQVQVCQKGRRISSVNLQQAKSNTLKSYINIGDRRFYVCQKRQVMSQ